MSERSPPPYGYYHHQRSYSSPNLAFRAEKRTAGQPANVRLAPQYFSAADGYRRTVYEYENTVGIEITVLSNATGPHRRPPDSAWLHLDLDDDGSGHYPRTLNPTQMTQPPEQQHGDISRHLEGTGQSADHVPSLESHRRYATPPQPLPPTKSDHASPEMQDRERRPSVTSGSSAYTGYNDETSSPSSQEHATPIPSATKPQGAGISADLKEAPISSRLYVQNGTSPKAEDESPGPESAALASFSTARAPRTNMPSVPPPIITRPGQLPASSRTYTPPAVGPSSETFSPVAAYMTMPHGVAFHNSTAAIGAYPSPKTASGAGIAPAYGLGSPRLNSSFPEYRVPDSAGYPGMQDSYGTRPSRGTPSHAPEHTRTPSRPSFENPGIASISPIRKQTKRRPVVTHACLTLNRMDRLKLVKFPPSAIYAVKDAIERSWVKGIQKERESAGQTEFQFRGNPWSGQGDDASPAIYMMSEVMSALYHLGWNLVMATDISKRALDKDTLIYRQGEIPSPCTFMAVSFNEGDKLQLIKAPNDVINAVKNAWGGNIQRESWKLEGIAWEFKLTGSPWWSSGDESLSVRIILLNMLDALHALGWELHSSVDVTAGPGGLGKNAGADTDSWILRKVNA